MVRKHIFFSGDVQGVGFRYRSFYIAQSLDLTGWVQNEDDGSVTLEVQGDPDKFILCYSNPIFLFKIFNIIIEEFSKIEWRIP